MSLVEIALLYFGTPYVWGGNDITTGLDCSGFVCEVSRSVGLLGSKDLTAQGLYGHYSTISNGSGIKKNSVLFFGKDLESISHVAIAIDTRLMIEAGGEGRKVSDKGYVRIRPITNRSDLVAALKVTI